MRNCIMWTHHDNQNTAATKQTTTPRVHMTLLVPFCFDDEIKYFANQTIGAKLVVKVSKLYHIFIRY